MEVGMRVRKEALDTVRCEQGPGQGGDRAQGRCLEGIYLEVRIRVGGASWRK